MMDSHQQCIDAKEHICQMPNGKECVEDGCAEAAGTWWGPLWCPEHDKERLDRISLEFDTMLEHP